jgi:hypothetical protein
MLWASTEATTENRELAPLPSLTALFGKADSTEGYLSMLGVYFDDHFAYRNELVSANSWLREQVFGVSATDQVVVGTDNWLYYNGTLADYLGAAPMSDAALDDAAHNIFLMQTYVESTGAQFVFTIAPNKNTLYPAHMPAFCLQASAPSNAERLKPYLERYGVHYVDLFETLAQAPDELYCQRDSHWTNEGALVAHTALMEALGRDSLEEEFGLDLANLKTERKDFVGDLELMLYPYGGAPETNQYYPGINDGPGQTGSLWSYTGTARDVTQDQIETAGAGEGTALMFRDSFGNALLPYLATQTQTALFSKLVPYNALLVSEREIDYVIVERAERHLAYLSENAPLAPSPSLRFDAVDLPRSEADAAAATLEVEESGSFLVLSGDVDSELYPFGRTEGAEDSQATILVSLKASDKGSSSAADAKELFWEPYTLSLTETTERRGFLAYISAAGLEPGSYTVSVLLRSADELIVLQSTSWSIE